MMDLSKFLKGKIKYSDFLYASKGGKDGKDINNWM